MGKQYPNTLELWLKVPMTQKSFGIFSSIVGLEAGDSYLVVFRNEPGSTLRPCSTEDLNQS